jgi:hypothetical protein
MLSRHQTEEDYAFMFKTIKTLSLVIFNHSFEPTILFADAAMEITNGFMSSFTEIKKRIVCWAHVVRQIKDNCIGVDKTIKAKIKQDFEFLQLSATS